ncbi:hemagglutinin repeat-containing protein [Enterobacter sp. Bisph1]|uniref:hemagglutinin repeat-containing protein n=1 Tax=Enterobacter sp. Bisph1 TaxID=1274399 RepID=UPI000A859511|nr:hemagglutinin repeat-containing protein [Enterobacter sp. Bisph1]
MKAADLQTRQQAQLQSGSDLTLTAADSATLNGTQAAKGTLSVTAKSASHGGKSNASAIALSAPDALNNSGTLVADTLNLTGVHITNSGLLQGTRALDVQTDWLDNLTGGTLYSVKDLTLAIPQLNNSGLITTDGDLNLHGNSLTSSGELNGVNLFSDYLNLDSSGRLLADNVLSLAANDVHNSGVLAAKNTDVTANTLHNDGSIQGDGALTLTAQTTTNTGSLATAGALNLSGQTLDNHGTLSATTLLLTLAQRADNAANGRITASDGLTLHAPVLLNQGLVAANNLTLDDADITNSGTLQGTAALLATGKTLANQQGGLLLSNGVVTLNNAQLTNAGQIQGGTLDLATGEWLNSGVALGENGLTATVSGTLDNQGRVVSQQGMTVQADALQSSGALMAKVLALHGDLRNSGLLQGTEGLTWDGTTLTSTADGQIISGDSLTLQGKTLDNAGRMQGRTLTATAHNFRNSGTVQAQDALNAQVTGILANQGQMLSQGQADIRAAQLNNDGTLAAKDLAITAPVVTSNGVLQGNHSLTFATQSLFNGRNGQLVSGGALDLHLDSLENQGLFYVGNALTLNARQLLNGGSLEADALDVTLGGNLTNSGTLLAHNTALFRGDTLTNSGQMAANTLVLTGNVLTNSGRMQGDQQAQAHATSITNTDSGTLLSGGALTLDGGSLSNAGIMQGDTVSLAGSTLNNINTINGLHGLSADYSGTITSDGQLISGGVTDLRGDAIVSAGRITGDRLTLNATSLASNGLWQGTNGLSANAGTLTTGVNSRTLSGGDFTLTAGQLTTQGTLQGGRVTVTADDWTSGGTLLSKGDLTAAVGNTLNLTGALESQGAMTLRAPTLKNDGQLLSAGDITLRGQQLTNNGTVQGSTLSAHEATITNNGRLTGLNSLTLDNQQGTAALMARIAMAAPQLTLINNASGSLLTQGTLDITAAGVSNAGQWQGNNILLAAHSLDNSGAVQSAGALNLQLAGNLNTTAGGKITAMGSAALQALSLTNNGQWAAKNLTLNAGSLTNSGTISGSDGLTATLNGAFTQQAGGQTASNGALNLTAQRVDNAGQIQGGGITLGADALTNSANAQLVSGQGITLTTPQLFNYGLIQGAGETRIGAATQARNEGKLLSGGALTLTTPQYSGAGWLQATDLILNAANNAGTGTLLADRMTLTGDTFTNQGTTQANDLTLNYSQLTNNGTLLGNRQLTVNAAQVGQSASGRLFSGGDLLVGATGLNALGQVVALGNLTLQLANAFTGQTALAAGKTLSISSNGAIDNQSVMQGQAVNLSAGGQLTNNGQITTGSGASTLSGSNIVLNGNSSLQGGGDVTLASRGNITANGFAGTLGSLTLSAPGSIVNTALLYAANNLALYANNITNQRGNMLAGNNLWLQRDAAGNANAEVINTSGSIETRNGDITVNTGHLLNQRDGLSASTTIQNDPKAIAQLGSATISVSVDLLSDGTYGVKAFPPTERCGGVKNEHCYTTEGYTVYAPYKDYIVQKFASSESTTTVSSTGGAALIQSGRNTAIYAGVLDNNASSILATGNISLSGTSLSNQSWQNSVSRHNYVYQFLGTPAIHGPGTAISIPSPIAGNDPIVISAKPKSKLISYKLISNDVETQLGDIYRSVIQAGGNVSANFSSNISNTNTTANAGGVSGTITAPSLNTLSNQGIGGSVAKQTFAAAPVAVSSPQWQDQLQNALQQINGGGALDSSAASGTALANIGGQQKGNASLGIAGSLANAGVTSAVLKNTSNGALDSHQGKSVDTSAYPLPTGNNGYFVVSQNPKSPYLITVNPKLDGLGQLDPALFGDLNKLLGITPSAAPRETNTAFTDQKQFLGSAYMLDRIKLNPDHDYRFLGDAAFDTRYVSNVVLNQTGNRYLNGIGSDLDQMRYLMDNAANAQQSLGLKFGVALSADQIAALDHSILWWESATIGGETVMIPKVYLSPKDVTVNNGSVIAGNNVNLNGGNVTNTGSTLLARNNLSVTSDDKITNSNDALIKAGGNVDLSAIGDISNISSAISGKTVALESLDGSINNLTLADQFSLDTKSKHGAVSIKDTTLGSIASITAIDGLSLAAGRDITLTGSTLAAGGNLLMDAGGNIAVNAIQKNDAYSQSGFWWRTDTSRATVDYQGSSITAGGNLAMQAGQDLTLTASNVSAGKSAQLSAGNDLNLNAQQTSQNNRSGKSENHSTGLDRTTISAGNNLTLTAGQDINSQAAGLAAEQQVGLKAGRDVNLQAEATTQGDSYKSSKKTVINEQVRQQGSEISSGTNTIIVAGRDMNAEAAQVLAKGDVGVSAGRDINLTTATESDYSYFEEIKTKKGFLSKKTTHTIKENSSTNELASLLSGNNVSLQAGNDLLVKGSAVTASGDIALKGGKDVTIDAATEKSSHYSMKKTTQSGVFGSGLSISIGSKSAKETRKGAEITQSDSRSVIGTTAGNIIIEAGDKAKLVATNMVAGRNTEDTTRKTGHIDVKASDIEIVAGKDVVSGSVKQESKSSGFGISFSNPIIDTVRNLRDIVKMGGSGISQAKVLAGEAAASAADIPGSVMQAALPISYGQSSSKSEMHYSGEYAVGNSLTSAGNVQLSATGAKGNGDVLINGSKISAKEAAIIEAQRNVDITPSTDTHVSSSQSSSKSWSVTDAVPTIGSAIRTVSGGPNHGASILPFSYGKENSNESSQTTAQTGSQITANDIYVNSKDGHVNLSGSSLAAIDDLMLSAQNGDITVSTGNNHVVKESSGSQTKIGSLGGDGYSGTVGWNNNKYASDLDRNQQSTLRSQIASRDGNVILQAGKDVAIDGADISAGKSVTLGGENVRLDVSEDSLKTHNESSNTQYGVKASVSGWAVTAAQAVENAARSVEENRDPRLSAIYTAQAGLSVATETVLSDMNPSAFKVNVNLTAGSSKQEQDYSSQQQQGSSIKAGDSVNIKARQDIEGSGVNIAAKNINLDAGRDISLTTAQDMEKLKTRASGNQFSVGAGFSLGGSQNGITVEAGGSTYSNKEDGNSLTHHNTSIVAEQNLTVASGRDTTLKGTELKGDKVALEVGRNLTIASQQDSDEYASKSSSGGVNVSVCVPPICAGNVVQGSVNAAGGKITNDFKSVIDQSGIYAGKGGFDIHVGDHTQLDGAVIASEADASKNRLDTGTLGWSDIHNKAASGGSQYAVSVSGGAKTGSDGNLQPVATGLPGTSLASMSDSASSTTHSAVAAGDIIIRDKDKQQQDIADLSRDTAGAHNALENNFDKSKIQDRLDIQNQAVALGTQAMDAWRQKLLDEGKNKIRADMKANGELDGLTEQQINDKIAASAQYKDVDKEYGVGSDFWRNGTAVTGLLAGVLGGNVTGGVAAGAAPFVAGLIKSATQGNEAARVALHTLASAVLVKAQGGSAAAGAAGGFIAAASSEPLSLAFYNKKPEDLSPDEKTVIVNLVAALGAAGGSVAAGNTSGIGSGANAARVEVENNTFLVTLHPDAYQDEFKKTGDPLYRLTDKYEQEVREHAEAGDPVAIQELQNLEEAKENAKAAIALYGVLAGGSTALSTTPELIALVRATASGCAGNPVLCANEVSIWIAEMAVGDALPVGLTAATVSKMSVTELSELKALMAVDKQSGNKLTAESLKSFVDNTAKNGQLPTSTVEQTITDSVIDPKKFDYLFGKATGSDHTIDRTNQLALEMKRLGVTDDNNGYAVLAEHFTQATTNPNNIVKKYTDQYGNFEVRQSFFIGPSGKATIFESTFEVTEEGAYRFITTIPKNGVTK